MAFNVMRELCNPDSRWAPEEVQFSRTKHADVSAYRRSLSTLPADSINMVTKCAYVSIVALGSMGKWIGLKCNLYGCRTAVIYLQQTGTQELTPLPEGCQSGEQEPASSPVIADTPPPR